MLAEGLSYPDAVELIKRLKDVGIEANLTVGAVRIALNDDDEDEIKRAEDLCEAAGGYVSKGNMSNLAGCVLLSHSMKTGKKIKLF